MRSSSIYWVAIPMVTLFACMDSTSHQAENPDEVVTDSAVAVSPLQSSSRKRIRTADIRCRVQNVTAATTQLEVLVTSLDGIVEESLLRNETQEQHEYAYSADSIKRVQLFTPVATLTLKVPVTHLDSVVHTLTAMAGYIDHRTLRDDDVTLQYLGNELRNTADIKDERVIQHTKKDSELDVQKFKEEKKIAAIERKITNLSILENVAYSTVTVEFFSPQVADVQMVINPDNYTQAGFGTQTLMALSNGVSIMRGIFIFFLQLWPLWIIATLLWLGYKRFLFKRA